MKYKVVKNFQDKYSKDYYGINSVYETEDAERAAELERGGFIVPEEAEANQTNKATKTATQTNQTSSEHASQSQKYTIIDGKKVEVQAQTEEHVKAEQEQQAKADQAKAEQHAKAQEQQAKAQAAQQTPHGLEEQQAQQAAQAKAKARTKAQEAKRERQ